MLYVKDNFWVIDKYLKNDEKFKYFSLKYNMISKSINREHRSYRQYCFNI